MTCNLAVLVLASLYRQTRNSTKNIVIASSPGTRLEQKLLFNQNMPFYNMMYLKTLLGSSQCKGIQRAATKIHKVAATMGIPSKMAQNATRGGALLNRMHITTRMVRNAVVFSGSFHNSTAKEHKQTA